VISYVIVELVINTRLSVSPSSGVDVINVIVHTIFTELSSFPMQTTWGTMNEVTVPAQTAWGTVDQSSGFILLVIGPYNVLKFPHVLLFTWPGAMGSLKGIVYLVK
jgi:hypothetical protein